MRRRDGRIEVRLNDAARGVVREAFGHVLAAERDPDHEWHASLSAPIDPSRDADDPLFTLNRQNDVESNVELAVMTLNEEFLNETEAWAWLSTLQIALRSTAVAHGLLSDEKLESCPEDVLHFIHALQAFLNALADCL